MTTHLIGISVVYSGPPEIYHLVNMDDHRGMHPRAFCGAVVHISQSVIRATPTCLACLVEVALKDADDEL